MIEDRFDAGVQSSHRVKYYSGNFESETINLAGVVSSREINYIFAPDGLAAIYEMKNGTGKMYYVSTDNLGSINMIADAQGNIVNDLSYDTWGRRRDAYTWETLTTTQLKTLQPTLITDRGYTMHEHMDAFGLVNMNGRAYDPLVGQFLSPDPFVQAGEYTQSYNRYSYCWNNPLKYSDPSGEYTVNLDGLIMNTRSEFLSNYSVGSNWGNIISLQTSGGFNQGWSDMDKLREMKFDWNKGRLGIWQEKVYWESEHTTITSINEDGEAFNVVVDFPTLVDELDFYPLKDMISAMNFMENEFGGSFAEGFLAGAQSTWGSVKHQFTWEGYMENMLNMLTYGAYGTYQTFNGLANIASNASNYTAEDYSYGAGFVSEKVFEVVLLKKLTIALDGGPAFGSRFGPFKQWVRFGTSKHLGQEYFSVRWGAGSPKFLNQIESQYWQDVNVKFRQWKGGHWDLWKK